MGSSARSWLELVEIEVRELSSWNQGVMFVWLEYSNTLTKRRMWTITMYCFEYQLTSLHGSRREHHTPATQVFHYTADVGRTIAQKRQVHRAVPWLCQLARRYYQADPRVHSINWWDECTRDSSTYNEDNEWRSGNGYVPMMTTSCSSVIPSLN